VDQNYELMSRYNVFSIPTLAVFNRRQLVSQQVGVTSNVESSLRNMIENSIKN